MTVVKGGASVVRQHVTAASGRLLWKITLFMEIARAGLHGMVSAAGSRENQERTVISPVPFI